MTQVPSYIPAEPANSVWLPEGMSFLSGLPTAARKRRVIVTIQAWVDESGSKGQGRWLVFSGIISTAERWANFSDAWREALEESPSISRFKMDEAAGKNGQFGRFTQAQRDAKLARLAEVIGSTGLMIEHSMTVDLDSAKRLLPHGKKPADDPYFWGFHNLIKAIGVAVAHSGYGEPFEIYFDENRVFGTRAKAWWPVLRAMAAPDLRAVLPVEPMFRTDDYEMPLQASDLSAWMRRHSRQQTNGFEWLYEHLKGLSRPPVFQQELGDADFGLMFDRDPLPADKEWMHEEARRAVIDEFFVKKNPHYVPKPKRQKD